MKKTISIGVLGHVDSGKTTLCKALSSIASTASFDKHPESKRRGITLDLGFSSFTIPKSEIQVALVDCPGHASLIRTIIGGSQIIEAMIIVVDLRKGIEAQTAESIVLAQVINKPVIFVVNKLDQFSDNKKRDSRLEKLNKRLKKISPRMVALSAHKVDESKIGELHGYINEIFESMDKVDASKEEFLFVFDHCFKIKGKGTVLTGTCLSGEVHTKDSLFLSTDLNTACKVKSIQMFHAPAERARRGDRVGILFTKKFPKKAERGYASKSLDVLHTVSKIVLKVNFIKYFKGEIQSRKTFNMFLGHFTCAGVAIFFDAQNFFLEDVTKETRKNDVYMLLQLEKPVIVYEGMMCIGAKLESKFAKNVCRFAFYSQISRHTLENDMGVEPQIFKERKISMFVDRISGDFDVIADGLGGTMKKKKKKGKKKKKMNLDFYIGKKIVWAGTKGGGGDVVGRIEGTFGASGKLKCGFNSNVRDAGVKVGDRLEILYKYNIFDPKKEWHQ